ncbi:PLP-dependent aminotransferase family protein [Xanthobacter tagetidis]|nr:PLP-dependent aminotransferase family protein [Xanthobacter tagetidis]MBB6309077.1 DNA-binding transcriptional MocR family regulator [Xanthobacter tagetidis]
MSDWLPSLPLGPGPRYLAIVDLLEADIAAGRVKPGARLLPQRDLAGRLGLSVGTVSKAYAEAEQRGLISGEVGRGTFVQRRRPQQGAEIQGVNLALNVPPSTGEADLIAATVAEIAAEADMDRLLSYLPHQGRRDHREAVSHWLGVHGMGAEPDQIFITHGAQHALSIAMSMVASRGDTVLTEALTYSGTLSLATQMGYRLHGVAMDREGLLPAALDKAFTETGARVLYCMPTLQTPTGTVLPAERRAQIAEIVRRHDAYVVEDDAYAFLMPAPVEPLAALVPERSFYVVSFAKCLAPGLRIGAMIAPDSFRDRCINGLRASGWMAVPLMAEVVARLVRTGGLANQAALKREQAALRNAIARRLLAGLLPVVPAPPGFHLWLPLPVGRTLPALIAQAAQRGITLAPPGSLRPNDPTTQGVRICLGAAPSLAHLEDGLRDLRRIFEEAEAISFV